MKRKGDQMTTEGGRITDSAAQRIQKEALVIVLDTSPAAFFDFAPQDKPEASTSPYWTYLTFFDYFLATLSFLSSYKLYYPESPLIVICAHPTASQTVFRGIAGDLDLQKVIAIVSTGVLTVIDNHGISQFPSALCKALACLSLFESKKTLIKKRIILVITEVCQAHYFLTNEVLTLGFAAKQLRVTIDIAAIFGEMVPVWYQLAHQTGGVVLSMSVVADLKKWAMKESQENVLRRMAKSIFSSFLNFFFLHPASSRELCSSLPATGQLENAAICSCHCDKIVMGKVCSTCFAVYCAKTDSKECSLCSADD